MDASDVSFDASDVSFDASDVGCDVAVIVIITIIAVVASITIVAVVASITIVAVVASITIVAVIAVIAIAAIGSIAIGVVLGTADDFNEILEAAASGRGGEALAGEDFLDAVRALWQLGTDALAAVLHRARVPL